MTTGESTVERRELLLAAGVALVVCALCLVIAALAPRAADQTFMKAVGDAAQLVAFVLGVPAAVFALFNHARSVRQQREALMQQQTADLWRRREFVANFLAAVERSENVRFAMALLDYNEREYKIPGTSRYARLGEHDLLAGLAPRDDRGVYGENDTAIRDAFDELFGGLDRLGVMMTAGLITYEDVEPYVSYWLELLEREPRERGENFEPIVRRYIKIFYFDGLTTLMQHVGMKTFTVEDQRAVTAFQAGLDSGSHGKSREN